MTEIGGECGFSMHRNGVARLGVRRAICDNARKHGQQNAAREANKRSRL
jgi:hypothetical protein